MNRAADINLLSDPIVFLEKLINLKHEKKWHLNKDWFNFNKIQKKKERLILHHNKVYAGLKNKKLD